MLFQKKAEDDHSQSFSPERHSLASPILPPQRRPDGLAPRAVIAAGINILGCLQTDGEVEVDGQINGDVRCGHLTVGKTGTIIGDVSADEVVVRGKLKGAIRAGRVIIQEGAHVQSDICHDKLSIEEGAYFKGTSTHNDAKEIGAPEPVAVALQLVTTDAKPPT